MSGFKPRSSGFIPAAQTEPRLKAYLSWCTKLMKINENLELVIDQIILAIIKRSKDHLHFSKEKRSLLL